MEKWELGIKKKSFAIPYNNGEIWCEHLDALGSKKELIKEKWTQDMMHFDKPATTSYMVIILNETEIREEEFEYIWETLLHLKKSLRKLAFSGADKKVRLLLKTRTGELNYPMKCFEDLERAKQWLMGKA